MYAKKFNKQVSDSEILAIFANSAEEEDITTAMLSLIKLPVARLDVIQPIIHRIPRFSLYVALIVAGNRTKDTVIVNKLAAVIGDDGEFLKDSAMAFRASLGSGGININPNDVRKFLGKRGITPELADKDYETLPFYSKPVEETPKPVEEPPKPVKEPPKPVEELPVEKPMLVEIRSKLSFAIIKQDQATFDSIIKLHNTEIGGKPSFLREFGLLNDDVITIACNCKRFEMIRVIMESTPKLIVPSERCPVKSLAHYHRMLSPEWFDEYLRR